jgi:HPt (histidine-containing phosphotransfer) domain-containing protein
LKEYNDRDNPKIQVRIEPELEHIIPGYLANRYKDVDLIRIALAALDYETIRIAGHSMKGSGGGYGFDAITGFGSALELSAKSGHSDVIERTVNDLQHYLDHVEVIYKG